MDSENSNPLVSIVVPVYKVEAYLRTCIDSIINQSYSRIEIIIVDDGSPDGCPQICDEYAKHDMRVKVIHKTNGGLSDARNHGIKESNGEYLFFVDSDDYIKRDAIEILVRNAVLSKADLVCAKHQSFIDGKNPDCVPVESNVVYYSKEEAMQHYIKEDWGAWGKLYKREVHENIYFPFGKIHEDEAIMLNILDRCEKICDISDKLYFYRRRPNSITSEQYSIKKMDWFYGWCNNVYLCEERYNDVLPMCIGKTWCVAIYNIDHLIGNSEYQAQINDIMTFAKKYWGNIIFNKHISISRKIRMIFFLASNIDANNCLYIRIYNTLRKVRRHE